MDSVAPDGNVSASGLCAQECFNAAYVYSTIPYYSLDAPRNVTLRYAGDRAAPHPIVSADVHILSSESRTLTGLTLQASANGTAQTFINGDAVLRFATPSPQTTPVRLAGELDWSQHTTGVYPVTMLVTAAYSNGTADTVSTTTSVLVVNDNGSAVGRGWTIAGLQRALTQSDGSVLVIDGAGSAIRFSPCPTKCSTYTTPSGEYTSFTAAGSGFQRLYPDSSRVEFDSTGRMVRAITRLKDTTAYGYDANGRLTKIYDPFRTYPLYGGGTARSYILLQYNTSGLLSQIFEPGNTGSPGEGQKTSVVISTADSTLTSITDPDSHATQFAYDASKRLATIIDRRGDSTTFAYDASWRLHAVNAPSVPVDAGGGTTTMQTPSTEYFPWQTVGVPFTSTATTPATPAALGQVVAQIQDPIRRNVTYTVNHWGQPLQVTGPLAQVTAITRLATLPASVVYPDAGKDSLGYLPGSAQPQTWIPAGDSALSYHYSVTGIPDSVWGAGQRAERRFFDAATVRLDSVRFNGNSSLVARYEYDVHHRLIQYRDINSHATNYFYDPVFGNVDSVAAPGNVYLVRRFDGYGRDTSRFQRGMGYWTSTRYDAVNRVTRRWHPGLTNDTTIYTYDALFPIRAVVAGGTLYKTDVDALGRPSRSYDGVDTTLFTSYRYDLAGRLTSETNRRGQRFDMQFDGLDRMTVRSGTGVPTDSFSYSANNRIHVAVRVGAMRDSLFLGVSGLPDSLVSYPGGHRFVLGYTRSKGPSRATQVATISGPGISFATEAEALNVTAAPIDSLTLSGTGSVSSVVFQHNGDGLLTGTAWNGSVPGRASQFTQLHDMWSSAFPSGSSADSTVTRYYARDGMGRITSLFRPYNGWGDHYRRDFTYDGLGRLIAVHNSEERGTITANADSVSGAQCTGCSLSSLAGPDETVPGSVNLPSPGPTPDMSTDTVTYDVAGNRTLNGAQYTATGNRLLSWVRSDDSVSYTYDADGNLATRTNRLRGVTMVDSLFWSARGQLDSLHSGGLRVAYVYDAHDQLVQRVKNGTSDRWFLWDGTQLLAELDGTAAHRIAQYLYHNGVDHAYAIATDSGGVSRVRPLVQDEVGNVIGVLQGASVAQYTQYKPWGDFDARPISVLADTNRLGWKGLMYEPDSTRLYYVRHRWYDAKIGRFISEDPAQQSANAYAFSAEDPVNGRDPSGMWTEAEIEDMIRRTCELDSSCGPALSGGAAGNGGASTLGSAGDDLGWTAEANAVAGSGITQDMEWGVINGLITTFLNDPGAPDRSTISFPDGPFILARTGSRGHPSYGGYFAKYNENGNSVPTAIVLNVSLADQPGVGALLALTERYSSRGGRSLFNPTYTFKGTLSFSSNVWSAVSQIYVFGNFWGGPVTASP